jgi:hypothetical protein
MAPSFKYARAIAIPAATLALICVLLALRVGVIPAASAGDDIWFSESAYWLLKTGVLSGAMHPDAVGSAFRDFLPPTPALFQAVSFRLLGLSQASMAIAPLLALYTIIFINLAIYYYAGVSYKLCGLLSIAFLAVPDALRFALQARYEIYEGLFLTLFFVFIERGLRIGNAALQFVSGSLLAAAGYSYYQFFPSVFFAVSCLVVFNIKRGSALKTIAAAPLGFLAVTTVFAMWIGKDFNWFLHQNMEFGRGYNLSSRLENLFSAPWRLQLQVYPLIAIGLINLIYVAQRDIFGSCERFIAALFSALGILSALLALVFMGQILLSTIAISLALAATLSSGLSREKYVVTSVLIGFSTASFVLLLTIAALAVTSDNRNYQTFARQLRDEWNLTGIVLIDNPAWLALREVTGRDQLVHVSGYAQMASKANQALILSSAEMAPAVSMLAVLPSRIAIEKELFPLIGAFLARDDVEGPITIGAPGPYQVLLYRVRRGPSYLLPYAD